MFLSQCVRKCVNTRPSAEELDLVFAVYIFKYTQMHMLPHTYIEIWEEANAHMYICKFPFIFVLYHFTILSLRPRPW